MAKKLLTGADLNNQRLINLADGTGDTAGLASSPAGLIKALGTCRCDGGSASLAATPR